MELLFRRRDGFLLPGAFGCSDIGECEV